MDGINWVDGVRSTNLMFFAVYSRKALAHTFRSKVLYVFLHLHTYVMLRCFAFSCTCTHTSCYAALRSLALAHIRRATLLKLLLLMMKMMMMMVMMMMRTTTTIKMNTKMKMIMKMEDDHDNDDDHADDNNEHVDETKVSFLPLFSSPPLKCLKNDNSREPLRDPAPCFRSWICRKKYLRTTTQDLSPAMHFMVTPPPNLNVSECDQVWCYK